MGLVLVWKAVHGKSRLLGIDNYQVVGYISHRHLPQELCHRPEI